MRSEKRFRRKDDPARWFLAFQSCNAIAFTMVLGAPIVLLARYLGASESQIGMILAIPPLLVGLQLVGVAMVTRMGPRRLMIWGWGTRSVVILPVALLPFLKGHSSTGALLWALAICVFLFSMLRGIASVSWLPWLSEVMPENRRGLFFGREQRVLNFSVLVTLLASGWFLGSDPAGWRYSVLVVVAFAVGLLSVYFLSKAPGGEQPKKRKHERAGLPRWKTMRRVIRHTPFRRTAHFLALQTFSFTAIPLFLILYLRDHLGWSEGVVLRMQSATTLGVLATAVLWGRLSDYAGSRPVLRLANGSLLFVIVFWVASAMGLFEPSPLAVGVAYAAWGMLFSMHAVAQGKLFIACSPEGHLTLSTALLQVVAAACAASAPIVWGFLLDGLGGAGASGGNGGFSLSFSLLFTICLVLGAGTQILLTRLPEPQALPTGRLLIQIFYGWPIRMLATLPVRGKRSQ